MRPFPGFCFDGVRMGKICQVKSVIDDEARGGLGTGGVWLVVVMVG
jgi:hypothetical protein